MSAARLLGSGPRARKRDALALLLLCLGLGFTRLDSVPRAYDDEAWEASHGYALATEGRLRNLVMVGCGGMEIQFVQTRIVLPFPCAGAYALVGDRGILTCRAVSVLVGSLAVLAVWALAGRFFDRRTALLSGLFLIGHFWFFEVTRRVRPEIYVLSFGALSLWVLFTAVEDKSRGRAAIGGLFLALAGLSHPLGWPVAGAISGGLAFGHKTRCLIRLLPWIALGGALALTPYLIYLLIAVQNPEVDYLEQMSACRPQDIPNLNHYLWSALASWNFFFQLPRGLPLLLVCALSIGAGFYRPTPLDRTAAITALLLVLGIPYPNGHGRYLVVITPLLALLVTRLVIRLWESSAPTRSRARRYRRGAALAVACIYLGTSLGAIALFFQHLRDGDLEALLERIGTIVGPDARVHGDTLFWLGHQYYHYVPRVYTNDAEYVTWLRTQRPDYVIRSAWLFLSGHSIDTPPLGFSEAAETPIDAFYQTNGTRIAAFRDSHYGPIEVYRMNWNDQDALEPQASPLLPDSQ